MCRHVWNDGLSSSFLKKTKTKEKTNKCVCVYRQDIYYRMDFGRQGLYTDFTFSFFQTTETRLTTHKMTFEGGGRSTIRNWNDNTISIVLLIFFGIIHMEDCSGFVVRTLP